MADLLQLIDLAKNAWEQGYRVVVYQLNDLLPDDKKINEPAPEPGMTQRQARLQLSNALTGLRPHCPNLPEGTRGFPWTIIPGKRHTDEQGKE